MWQLTLLALSLASATLWYKTRIGSRYRLDVLALISGGAAVMFFVDSLYSYVEGGELIEVSPGSALLSAALVSSTIALWLAYTLVAKLKK